MIGPFPIISSTEGWDKLLMEVPMADPTISGKTCILHQYLNHEKKWPYFPFNPGWLIGILISWFYDTPQKINIEPENDGLEDKFPFTGVYYRVPC